MTRSKTRRLATTSLLAIILRESVWAEYLSANGIRPFVEQSAATVSAILHYLEVERPVNFEAPAPAYQRISSDLSEEWIQRFRREKQRDYWIRFW